MRSKNARTLRRRFRSRQDEPATSEAGSARSFAAPGQSSSASLILGLLFAGTYEVGPGEQAVIRTFGRETGKAGPGLHFSFPLVQRRDVVNVEQVRRMEVGFRGQQRVPDEALMLTGDENIVDAQIIVQYRVSDTSKYLFRLKDPDETLRATAEVALRSMVGRRRSTSS